MCEEVRNAMLIGMVSKDAFDCGVKPSINIDFELVLDNLSWPRVHDQSNVDILVLLEHLRANFLSEEVSDCFS